MKVYKPNELLALPLNSVPDAIQGTITKLQANPVEGGEGEKAYKFQNATLEMEGESIRIVFNNRETLDQSYNGADVIVKAKSKKDGTLFGLKRKVGREYQGEKPPEVWVYEHAELSILDPDQVSSPPQAIVEESETETETESTKKDQKLDAIRPHFNKMISAMNACIDSAYFVAKQQEEKGRNLSEEHIRTIASSFFIQADRQGLINKIK